MAQLVASVSGVVLDGVAEVVGSNLARGKIFTAVGSVGVWSWSWSLPRLWVRISLEAKYLQQLVASVSGVVLGVVAEVVGSNLARGKIFTASIGSVDSLYPSV